MQKFVFIRRSIVIFSALFITALPVQAGLISVTSYQYNSTPSSSYPDSAAELTDGITDSLAWGSGLSIGYSDVANLTGWLNTNPSITFNFNGLQTVNTIKVFAADSDGAAGVALPLSVLVSTAEGFSQLFNVTNPAGDGKTVALDLTGFSTSSAVVTLTMQRSAQWTMLSEVQFFDASTQTNSVPAPATWLLSLGAMLVVMRKRLIKQI